MATVSYSLIGGRIVAENRGGTRKYYSCDALGSTVALYDNSQTKTDAFTYWPYGETRTRTGSTPTKYKFVGALGCREQADGGIYMQARVEQPKDGRWMTVDPLWPSEPAYGYSRESPATRNDPHGLDPCLRYHKNFGRRGRSYLQGKQCFEIRFQRLIPFCPAIPVPCAWGNYKLFIAAEDFNSTWVGGGIGTGIACAKICKLNPICLAICGAVGGLGVFWLTQCQQSWTGGSNDACIEATCFPCNNTCIPHCCHGYA